MAYGTPNSLEDIEAYLTNIRRGRKPSPEAVEELKERYRKIGGKSPLLDITKAQASALQEALNLRGVKTRVYVGMKYWHPYIAEVLPQIARDGFPKAVGLVLAPHYSQISIGGYKEALDKASSNLNEFRADLIESWYNNKLFHKAAAEKISLALRRLPSSSDAEILFTAHSLPERILKENDPYPEQLRSSCQAVADILDLKRWSFAYQSAARTREKWLGPDILEALERLSQGITGPSRNVVIVPIGFVADHLEILYDIDVEARQFAEAHHLNLIRTESLNTSPTFIAALADMVRNKLG